MKFARPVACLALAAALAASHAMAEEKVSNPAILSQLAKAVDEMADPGGPAGVLDVVDSADRKRVDDAFKKADLPEHGRLAKELRAQWKKKYGKDFKLSDHLDTLQGRPVERFTHKDREYATVNFTQFGSDGPFEVRLIKNEKSGEWHVLLNPRLEGDRFAKRVEYALSDMVAKVQYWPKEEDSAYAIVGRRLLDTFDYDPRSERQSASDRDRDDKKKDRDEKDKKDKR